VGARKEGTGRSQRVIYRIEITRRAQKQIAGLDRAVAERVAEKIDTLAENPRPRGITAVRGEKDVYRIRVGQYRIVYVVKDEVLVVVVFRVRHRDKDTYKGL